MPRWPRSCSESRRRRCSPPIPERHRERCDFVTPPGTNSTPGRVRLRQLEAHEPAVPDGGVRRVANERVAQALLDLGGGELGERGELLGDPRAQPVEAGEAGAELGCGELGVEE